MSEMYLTRNVTKDECHWLERDFKTGELVHRYYGATYGCIGPNGTAVSEEQNFGPFFELPSNALSSQPTDDD